MAKSRKSSYSFKGKTSARAEKDKRDSGASYGHLNLPTNFNVFSPEPGKTVKLDFLPYIVTSPRHPDKDTTNGIALKGDPWYRYVYWRHTNLGADGRESCVCLTTVKKKCPVCEYRAKLMREGADRSVTDNFKPSKRVLYIVVPVENAKYERKPHLFDFSYYNMQNLLDDELREDEDNSVFPNLEGGLTLKIRFASKTIADSKPFPQASRIDFLERDKDYPASTLSKMPSLDDVLKLMKYEEIEALLFEMDDSDDDEDEEDGGTLKDIDDDEDEDDEPTPKRKRKTNHGKKQVVEDEDEDEDDELDEDDNDDEPEEKPTPKRKAKVSRPKKQVVEDDEDDDEDDEDDDEDEDEAPAPRRKAKPAPAAKGRKAKPAAKTKEKCPHGHTFGGDNDQFEECEDCNVWDACYEESEK